MKKVLLVLLALIMVLSMVTTAVAVPGNGMPPGQAKKNVTESSEVEISEIYFDDLTGVEWAENEIMFMAQRGVLKGEGNKKFVPNRPVKEGELVIMMLRMLDKNMETTDYSDEPLPEWFTSKSLKVDEWMNDYIVAADDWFTNPDFKTRFNPNKPATRGDVAFYILCMLELLDFDSEMDLDNLDSASLNSLYIDGDDVSMENGEAVLLMNTLGLMIGNENGEFQPNKPLTRAECAMLMHRLFNNFEFNMGEFNYGKYDEIYRSTTLEAITIDEDGDNTTLEAITLEGLDSLDVSPDLEEINIANNCCKDAEDEIDLGDFIEDAEKYEGLLADVYVIDETVVKVNIYYYELTGELDSIDHSNDLHLTPYGESESIEFDYKNDFDEDVKFFENGTEIETGDYEEFYMEDSVEYEVKLRLLANGDIISLCINEIDED